MRRIKRELSEYNSRYTREHDWKLSRLTHNKIDHRSNDKKITFDYIVTNTEYSFSDNQTSLLSSSIWTICLLFLGRTQQVVKSGPYNTFMVLYYIHTGGSS